MYKKVLVTVTKCLVMVSKHFVNITKHLVTLGEIIVYILNRKIWPELLTDSSFSMAPNIIIITIIILANDM